MSETFNEGQQDGIRDEVRLDLDEEAIEDWNEVRGDYVDDPDAEVTRPELTEDEDGPDDVEPLREDDEEDDLAEDEDEDAEAREEE